MRTTTRKGEMLENAGYAYSFDRLSYINRQERKVFSIEFVQDHDEAELKTCINEPIPAGEWRFYFNTPPSPSTRTEFLRHINGR